MLFACAFIELLMCQESPYSCLGHIPSYNAEHIAQHMGTHFPVQALFCLNSRQIKDLLSHTNMPKVLAENLFSNCNQPPDGSLCSTACNKNV
jgi:hypothetical protein